MALIRFFGLDISRIMQYAEGVPEVGYWTHLETLNNLLSCGSGSLEERFVAAIGVLTEFACSGTKREEACEIINILRAWCRAVCHNAKSGRDENGVFYRNLIHDIKELQVGDPNDKAFQTVWRFVRSGLNDRRVNGGETPGLHSVPMFRFFAAAALRDEVCAADFALAAGIDKIESVVETFNSGVDSLKVFCRSEQDKTRNPVTGANAYNLAKAMLAFPADQRPNPYKAEELLRDFEEAMTDATEFGFRIGSIHGASDLLYTTALWNVSEYMARLWCSFEDRTHIASDALFHVNSVIARLATGEFPANRVFALMREQADILALYTLELE